MDNVSLSGPLGDLYDPEEPVEILLNPWQNATIGSGTGFTGVRNDNALYSLRAAGGSGTAPVTEFMYREERSGDALYVSVSELQSMEADGAVGLMIRNGLYSTSSYAFLKVTPKGLILETYTDDETSSQLLSEDSRTLPLWLRIDSYGSSVTVSQSQDVENWQSIGSTVLPTGSSRYFGIAAHSLGGEVTGAFSRPRLIHSGDDTLEGIDTGVPPGGGGVYALVENGIRDDVEHYVKTNYLVGNVGTIPGRVQQSNSSTKSEIRDALLEIAKAGTALLTDSGDDTSDPIAEFFDYTNAKSYALAVLGEGREYEVELVESELFDTLDRLLLYIEYASAATKYYLEPFINSTARGQSTENQLTLETASTGCPVGSSPGETVLAYSNGMRTSRDELAPSLDAIAEFLPELRALHPDILFASEIEVAYTPGDFITTDLAEIEYLRHDLREHYQECRQVEKPCAEGIISGSHTRTFGQ